MSAILDLASAGSALANNTGPSDVLFVTECSPWGKIGYDAVSAAFPSVRPVYWSPGTPKPDLSDWYGDWVICFKADLILPRATLERAKKGAINFHPSPPKYRGIGGYWWALHNEDDIFGVTCHHMDERIDHGPIIATESFPVWAGDTVESLKHRAALYSLALLNETLNRILEGKPLMPCDVQWKQHLYTYQELAAAQRVPAMNSALNALKAVAKQDFGVTLEQDQKRIATRGRNVA